MRSPISSATSLSLLLWLMNISAIVAPSRLFHMSEDDKWLTAGVVNVLHCRVHTHEADLPGVIYFTSIISLLLIFISHTRAQLSVAMWRVKSGIRPCLPT